MIAALVWTALAVEASPVFAPPLGTPVRYTIRETRSDGGVPQAYTITRSVIFRRDGDGFTADVTTTAVEAQPANLRADLFVAAASGFLDRSVRLHLDRQGQVFAVTDRQKEWDGWLDRMAAAMKRSDARTFAGLERFIAELRPASPARQVETLGAYVGRIVGSDVVARGPHAPSPIRLPAAGPAAAAELDGTEHVIWRPDATLRHERTAQGAIGANGRMRTSLLRTVDTRTGLIAESRETTRYTLSGRTLTSERITTLAR